MNLFGNDARGHDVLKRFHLAVANSGGSVILACLALDKPLSEILTLYTDESKRRSTFRSTPFEWFVGKISGGRAPYPLYSTAKKREALSEHLGHGAEVLLSDWRAEHPRLPNLVITAFDYDVERATFYRTNHASLAASSQGQPDVSLLDAVHASTTAPLVFFDEPARVRPVDGRRLRCWDGAFAALNNPIMAGVVEALAERQAREHEADAAEQGRRRSPRDIHVLSIGSGTVHRPRRPPGVSLQDPRFMGDEPSGWLRDVQKAAGAMVDDPPDSASFMAHVALGGELPRTRRVVVDGPIVRMSPVVRPAFADGDWTWPPGLGNPSAPGVLDAWARLTRLRLDALAERDMDLIRSLCEAWFRGEIYNQPIRANEATLDAEIGHDTYGAARAAACRLFGCAPRESSSRGG
jgi:hypothetical protein